MNTKIGPLFKAREYDVLKDLFDEDPSLLSSDVQRLLFDTAINAEDFDGMDFLLSTGYDINEVAHTGTPLSRAAYEASDSLINWLISKGAVPSVSSLSCNPLFTAIQGGNAEIVRYFLDYGLDPSVRYSCGRDAIDFARTWSNPAILELLGDDGSRPKDPHVKCSIPDYSGLRPSEEMLTVVERELGISLPHRLKQYLVHELPDELFFPATRDNDEWKWLGADAACFHTARSFIAYNSKDPQSDQKQPRFSDYVVFGNDGCGNDYCIKTTAQDDKVWIHDHETEEFEDTQMTLRQFTDALIANG